MPILSIQSKSNRTVNYNHLSIETTSSLWSREQYKVWGGGVHWTSIGRVWFILYMTLPELKEHASTHPHSPTWLLVIYLFSTIGVFSWNNLYSLSLWYLRIMSIICLFLLPFRHVYHKLRIYLGTYFPWLDFVFESSGRSGHHGHDVTLIRQINYTL